MILRFIKVINFKNNKECKIKIVVVVVVVDML